MVGSFPARYLMIAALLLPIPAVATAAPGGFQDPLDVAAVATPRLDTQPFIAIAATGGGLVAVGPRGLVADWKSANAGWIQARVPVQSDLVAVQFVDPSNGWAVGHDGVILHTQDGGANWTKQLDGREAGRNFITYYDDETKAGNSAAAADLQDMHNNFDQGPILPWLGVCFTNTQTGYAVGPFGNIAETSDGGTTWIPWLEHIDDPNFFDLNAIADVDGNLFIVGEQGSVFWFDPSQQRFVVRQTNYAGSLFGLAGGGKTLLVFGLRGTILRSTDLGKSWAQSKNPSQSSIMSGVRTKDGKYVLVTVDGSLLESDDDGQSFLPVQGQAQNAPLTDVVEVQNGLVMTSLGGIRRVTSH